jgi:hypothetical protein
VKISGDGISDGLSAPLPLTAAYFSTQNSDNAQMEANLDLCTEVSNSDTSSEIDETDLGAFLMDTFEAMEAQGSLLTQLEMPV